MNSPNDCRDMPDWKLERYLLGELPREDLERIRREAECDPSLSLRLAVLKESDRDILDRYPASSMSRHVREQLENDSPAALPGKSGVLARYWPIPALPAAAVLILLAILPSLFTPKRTEPGMSGTVTMTRIKGIGPKLLLYRKTDAGSEPLENGNSAREHDTILIQYQPAGKTYGVIFSIDGRGTISRHLPLEGDDAFTLEQGGPVSLDFSYELDDAPRWEKFFFVTSDAPFAFDPALQAARRCTADSAAAQIDSLDLPADLNQFVITVRKEDHE